MIIFSEELNTPKKPQIDLRGEDGNAFALLSKAKRLMQDYGETREVMNAIMRELMESDYNNLVRRFDYYFGEYVDLVTDDVSLIGRAT